MGGVECAGDMAVTIATGLRTALRRLAAREQFERRLDVVAGLEHEVERKDVETRVLHLVVIRRVPAIEVQLHPVVLHARDGRGADQCGTPAINSSQAHANFKADCLPL